MQDRLRVITSLPITELWNSHGRLDASRIRYLDEETLRQVLQAGSVIFAIANVGDPLRWIAPEESHVLWKLEVRPHLVVEPERPFNVFKFQEGYCYIASEWQAGDSTQLAVVLEKHH